MAPATVSLVLCVADKTAQLACYSVNWAVVTSSQPIRWQQVCHLVQSSECASGIFLWRTTRSRKETPEKWLKMASNMTEEASVEPGCVQI